MLISRDDIKKLQAVKSEENKEIIDEIVNYFNAWAGVGYNTDDLVYLPKGLSEKLESLNLEGDEMKRNKEIRIRLTKEEMEIIEKVAKKLNMPKARLIRNMTFAGLEDAGIFAKMGLFDLVKMIEKIREKALETKDLNYCKPITE
ncbi:hypothetical protein [Caminibacter sp.]